MKRIYLFLAFLGACCGLWAQESVPVNESNRILVNTVTGSTRGYMTERVKDITFGYVEGAVKAEVNILKNEPDSLLVSIAKSDDCVAYKLGVLPAVTYRAFRGDQAAIVEYMTKYGSMSTFYDDYTRANLSGLELEPGTEYVLMTIGVDIYGVDCDVCVRNFATQPVNVVGNPQVAVEVTAATTRGISLKFTPNADCSEYYFVIDKAGMLQEQFDMWAPMFGFKNIGEMIKGWGSKTVGNTTYEYKDLDPNTAYELYVLPVDCQGNPAMHQIVEMSTKNQGGSGVPVTNASVTAYKLSDWGGEMKPSVFVKFTPNDQTMCYRFGVFTAANFNAAAVEAELAQEPPMPNMAYWFWFDEMETDFQVNPNTEIVICTVSKNADGKWGQMQTVRYTTPATATAAQAPAFRAPKPCVKPQQPNTVRHPRKLMLIGK